MIYALQYLRGERESFAKDNYTYETIGLYKDEIMEIINKRQENACDDWKVLGEKLSGEKIDDFNIYSLGLMHSAFYNIRSAFRKTAMVHVR